MYLYAVSGIRNPVSYVLAYALTFVFFDVWFVLPLAWLHAAESHDDSSALPDPAPPVAVLVPAYNEEQYIGRCVESLAKTTYPGEVEIVVIDDGSTDGTYEEALAIDSDRMRILQKENGGKFSALNYGLEHTTAELILTVDADSLVAEDAIGKMVAKLVESPDVGAVAGTVRLLTRESFLEKLQSLEYVFGINSFRRAFDIWGAVNVVPGCLGGFRRTALEEAGGYAGDTLTEDFEITVQILRHGWQVRASNATVYTEAPDTLRSLYKQRLRWRRGTVQTLLKHRDVLFAPQIDNFTSIVYPYMMFSRLLLPFPSLVALGVLVHLYLIEAYVFLVALIVSFLLLQTFAILFVLLLDDETLLLIGFVPIYATFFKYFIDIVTLKAMFEVATLSDLSWTTADRQRQRQPTAQTEQTGGRGD